VSVEFKSKTSRSLSLKHAVATVDDFKRAGLLADRTDAAAMIKILDKAAA